MNGEKCEFSKGYRVIVRFFKEIGLYYYFLEYQRGGYKSLFSNSLFDAYTTDPIRTFAKTGITYYIRGKGGKLGKLPNNETLFYPFIYFLECFYPEFYHSTSYNIRYYEHIRKKGEIPCCAIDFERKKIYI